MQFNHLKSLVTSGKHPFQSKAGAPLLVPVSREAPYIEPTLRKDADFFPVERPSVVLVSAVGATGKSALAHVLADAGHLPLLDLSRHKAVGDNTISGLVTNSYGTEDLGPVFGGLKNGSFGMIIDGLDEGRSKTTEQGFEAFLDDIANLCAGAPKPSFVLLGRSDIVDSAWLHLSTRGVNAGLLSIEPFDRNQAHQYIDKISEIDGTPHTDQYAGARDAILNCLSAAFGGTDNREGHDSFLSFIGYPPVLDAVATVLKEERNFFRLENEIVNTEGGDREIELLTKICAFVLEREQRDKVWINILKDLSSNVPETDAARIKEEGFNQEEQCGRLLAFCLGRSVNVGLFADDVLDIQYERQVGSFFTDHPFITGKRFRNAVFEAYALSNALYSSRNEFQQLAMDYIDEFRVTYHLVYLSDRVSRGRRFPLRHVRALIASALDFRSRTSDVVLDIDGGRTANTRVEGLQNVSVDISILAAKADERGVSSRTFRFTGEIEGEEPINLGSSLADAFIFVPHRLTLRARNEIKLLGPTSIFCSELTFDAQSLSVSSTSGGEDPLVIVDTDILNSSLQSLSVVGSKLEIFVPEAKGFGYPLVSHIRKIVENLFDPDSKAKYLRLRKVLTHFRSHSKGQLAKYADKVENERVAGNEMGTAIVERLLQDGVLKKDSKFYYIDPAKLHEHLGVNWTDLRSGVTSAKLLEYLTGISVA